MLRILVLLLVILTSVEANCQDLKTLIGKTIQPSSELEELKNYKKIGGALIQDNYGIANYRDNHRQVILFQEVIRNGDELSYKILDALKITTNNKSDFIGYQLCRSDGKLNDRIIAWVKLEDKEYYDVITKAWMVNMSTLKFESIRTEGIDCYNEGWGTGY
jgi:hypothetical protein